MPRRRPFPIALSACLVAGAVVLAVAGTVGSLSPAPAFAQDDIALQELQAPEGMVLLTVAGAIKHANRGAPSFLEDPFLGFHELQFEQAAAWDREMLEGLEQASAMVRLSQWQSASRLEGPSLMALLEAVGAPAGSAVAMLALDGFRVELTAEDIEAHAWIVAITRDGKPLGIGAHGPAWVLYAPAAADHLATREESSGWPWTAFYVEVIPPA